MEEKKEKTAGEGESLNSGILKKIQDDNMTYSQEEVENIKREITSNTEKGVQKLLRQVKLLKEALNELSKIASRQERLIELVDENKELAELLLDEYFGESLVEYKTRIGYTKDLEDPKRFYKRLERESSKKALDRIIELEKERFIKRLQMTPEERLSFDEVFENLRTTKEIDLENLDSIFEKSYSIANVDTMPHRDFIEQEFIGKLMTISGGKGSTRLSRSDKEAKIRAEVKEFLTKNKLI